MLANDRDLCEISLGTQHFKEANERIRLKLESHDDLRLTDVMAQRYLGCSLEAPKHLEVHGVPGNDMACFMDGGSIEVFGNAQDQVANTMNDGRVVIHGRCGDAAGYAMRGGTLLVRDGAGWRVGINMKEYADKRPRIVIGGDAGSFLGEYMAGGVIVLLGDAGEHLATGMHGGAIFMTKAPDESNIAEGLVVEEISDDDIQLVAGLLREYDEAFAEELGRSMEHLAPEMHKLSPISSRPYASLYAS